MKSKEFLAVAAGVFFFGRGALAQTLHSEEAAKSKVVATAKKAPASAPYQIRFNASSFKVWHSEVTRFSFQIVNASDKPVLFVPPLDGSFSMRFPRATVTITDKEGRLVEVQEPRDCGTTNSLRDEDFTTLQPGEARTYGLAFYAPTKLGEYSLRVVYDTSQRDLRYWLGSIGPEEAAKKAAYFAPHFARLPAMRAESDAVSFEVEGMTIDSLELLFLHHIVRGATPETSEQIYQDLQKSLWRLEEKREHDGHLSAVLRFAPNYKLPPTRVAWPAGRYLVAPYAAWSWTQLRDPQRWIDKNHDSYLVVPQEKAASTLQEMRSDNPDEVLQKLGLVAENTQPTPTG